MNANTFQMQMQQLVDRELSYAARGELLRSMESRPESWQALALAFVERQIMDEALAKEIDADVVSQSNVATLLIAPQTKTRPVRGRQLAWWAAIGVCLLLGFVGGRLMSTGPTGIDVAAHDRSATGATKALLLSETVDGQSVKMPLEDALARSPSPLPVDFRRNLMKRGYLVSELAHLTKVQLPTGEIIDLPVRQVDVMFVGNVTYQ